MQLTGKLSIVTATAVAICLLVLATHWGTGAAEPVAVEKQDDVGAKLLDFDYYKERFGKKYASVQENLARKAYFVARALRAFVSGMNFKWRRLDYFLAINHLSDSSPEELDRRRNKVLARQSNKSHGALPAPPAQVSDSKDELPEFLAAVEGDDDLQEKLRKLAEIRPNEPGYRELLEVSSGAATAKPSSRRKRSVGSRRQPRDFSLDQLMKPGVREPVRERPEVVAKIASDAPSNNPHYQQPEISTQGLNDHHKPVQDWYVAASTIAKKTKEAQAPVESQLKSSLSSLSSWIYSSLVGPTQPAASEVDKLKDEQDEDEEEDEKEFMYFDHRDSDCLLAPRDQGTCGSCYAFAAIAYMEWLYCTKNKDQLIPFSEQYMVDCGKNRYADSTGYAMIDGCEGSTDYAVFMFIQNFGLERAKRYPYMEREGQCPYDEQLNIKQTGYIRMELDDYAKVPVSRWEEYIEHGPLYTGIATPADYSEYSGGVHDGHNCGEEGDHAQLLVGHGREDGKDFWLLRNSYGANWGDNGYFKLSKDAPKRCIDEQRGYALGTQDAINYSVEPRKNRRNKKLREERRRAKQV